MYDGNRTAAVTLSDDRVAGDTFNAQTFVTARFGNKNVGVDKTVTVNGIDISGGDAKNYNFNTTTTALADITKRDLNITAVADDKVYDGNRTATVTLSDDRVAGDTFNAQDYNNARFDTKNVGVDKLVTINGIDIRGGDAQNYNFNTTTTALADITKRDLNITAVADDKVYDGNRTAAVTLSDDRVAGDTFNAQDYNNARFDNKNVGVDKLVTVNGINIRGGDARNYNFNTTTTALADITARDLTVTANDQTQTYADGNNLTQGFTSSGLQGTDAIDTVDLITNATLSTSGNWNATNGTPWSITGSNAAGTSFRAGNYNITYVDGGLTINKKSLDINADADSKVYDGNRTASVTLSDDRVAGDVLSATNADALFDTKDVGGKKSVTVSGINVTGADAGNYDFNTDATAGAAITPRSITVTADGKTKVYGSADPSLTFTNDALQGSDTLGEVFSGSLSRDVGEHVIDGPFAINQGSLASNDNYTIDYIGDVLVITPADLNVVADNKSVVFGATLPALTYVATGFQFADNEAGVLTGALSTVPSNSLIGVYPIEQGTLASNPDYNIVYTPGELTIQNQDAINASQLQTNGPGSLGGNGGRSGTLLSMTNGGGGNSGGGNLGDLAPAAGGENPGSLEPAAGGTTSLIDCTPETPCEATE